MADGRHVEIVKAPYLNEKLPISIKFGSQKRIPIKMTVISPKFKILEFQDGVCRRDTRRK